MKSTIFNKARSFCWVQQLLLHMSGIVVIRIMHICRDRRAEGGCSVYSTKWKTNRFPMIYVYCLFSVIDSTHAWYLTSGKFPHLNTCRYTASLDIFPLKTLEYHTNKRTCRANQHWWPANKSIAYLISIDICQQFASYYLFLSQLELELWIKSCQHGCTDASLCCLLKTARTQYLLISPLLGWECNSFNH